MSHPLRLPDPEQGPPQAAAPADDPGGIHPDHHLWRNGRMWWVAFTVHHPDWTAERVRRSLGTDDLAEARRRRDALLLGYEAACGARLSLRFTRRVGTRRAGA